MQQLISPTTAHGPQIKLEKATRNTDFVIAASMRTPEYHVEGGKAAPPFKVLFLDAQGNLQRIEASTPEAMGYWRMAYGRASDQEPHTGLNFQPHRTAIIHMLRHGNSVRLHSLDRIPHSNFTLGQQGTKVDAKEFVPERLTSAGLDFTDRKAEAQPVRLKFDVGAEGVLASFDMTSRPVGVADDTIIALVRAIDAENVLSTNQKLVGGFSIRSIIGTEVEILTPGTSEVSASNKRDEIERSLAE
jgi:hypothetical protein